MGTNRDMGRWNTFSFKKRENQDREVDSDDNDILRVTSIYERRCPALLSDSKNVSVAMATYRGRGISADAFRASDSGATRLIGRREKRKKPDELLPGICRKAAYF